MGGLLCTAAMLMLLSVDTGLPGQWPDTLIWYFRAGEKKQTTIKNVSLVEGPSDLICAAIILVFFMD